MSNEAILTHELTKVYGTKVGRRRSPALDALNLCIRENEVFGFLGQNGAGKTTTIKILSSLLRPTRGTALILGIDATRRAARRWFGYLPENPYFYEYLTPRETLDFYGKLHGLDSRARSREWDRLADMFDLAAIGDLRVRGFSKGMRQRLAFAAALVSDPPILILDEPMSGLDPLGRRRMRDVILHLRDAGKTIFFSSHVLSDVEQICDRVGILVRGRLSTQGRIDQLLEQRIRLVEVIAQGLSPDAVSKLARTAAKTRASEAGHHFLMSDAAAADALVRSIHALGGRLVEFSPVRESLEDYFMREQGGEAR